MQFAQDTHSVALEPIQTLVDSQKVEQKYQSAHIITNSQIQSNSNGNGDIASVVRILPNVQFDSKQMQSTTSGEIAPANISISGGLYYQNLFLLDGMSFNNDLNPAGNGNWLAEPSNRSQGLAINANLLESISIQDSNIDASYGNFNGGVIEAITKRPLKKFSTSLSYRFTQGNADGFSLTQYYIYNGAKGWQDFINSSSETMQPLFFKHILYTDMQSKINDKLAIIMALSATQSFIPIRATDDDYLSDWATTVDPKNSATRKQTQNRQIYNLFSKLYYDVDEKFRLEFSYTYAPEFDFRFLVGTQDDYYRFQSGGHQIGQKIFWENTLGTLKNTLSYLVLENSTYAIGYENIKYWQTSDSKNWSNWGTWQREGGHAPVTSLQHSLTNKITQDFIPFYFLATEHKIQTGLEVSYQLANFYYNKNFYTAIKTSTFMTQEQQKKCSDFNWCDLAKAYDPRGFEANDGVNVIDGIWIYGQYFNQASFYRQDKIIQDNLTASWFVQDDILIPLAKAGEANLRVGARLENDTYMKKTTFAHRISMNYLLPWNTWEKGKDFATQITGGINRYYGRNIFAYALKDGISGLRTDIYRDNPDISWEEILESNVECSEIVTTNCFKKNSNNVAFSRLKIPYIDEYTMGITQKIFGWKLEGKYIYRQGRDEVLYIRSDSINLSSISGYSPNYYTYTNDGKSDIHIITLMLSNLIPLEFYQTKHHLLIAFDWTDVKRNFNDYATNSVSGQINDNLILWDNKLIYWSQRPADNFVRPYTIRLNTTHNLKFKKWNFLINNFLRYRGGYYAYAYRDNVNITLPDNTSLSVREYKTTRLPASFTWDIKFGFEYDFYKKNTLFFNIDIFNLLNNKNIALANGNYLTGIFTPIYELGRQFWFEIGYKF